VALQWLLLCPELQRKLRMPHHLLGQRLQHLVSKRALKE
jgi:hypothetical protein